MSGESLDHPQWTTVAAQRQVLFVARTATAAGRLFDVFPLLSGDTRLETKFAVDHGSVFSQGLTDRLTAIGARVLAWEQALNRRFDLAVAASDNGDLHRLRAPLMLLPHGVGYHRYSPGTAIISGLSPAALTRGERIVPRILVVAHPSQVDTIRSVAPRLVPRTLVAGDPCVDRMSISTARREQYRAAAHARNRHVVVVCSTWGPQSLYGRFPDLPARLLGDLPTDEYRVLLVLHPNVWARHGELQVRSWLRPAIDAGLVIVPPQEGWRAAVLASDLVISDHGSVTCYAVATGKTVVLAADGGDQVVRDSPMDTLRQRLPRLCLEKPLRAQVEDALERPGQKMLSEAIFSNHGRSGEILREAMYEVLHLSPPPWPVRLDPLPVPVWQVQEPTAQYVYTTLTDTGTVTMKRFPANLDHEDHEGSRHLSVLDSEVDPGLVERAAVVSSASVFESMDAAADWARETLARFPGARIAAAASTSGSIFRVRDGKELSSKETQDVSIAASALYACLTSS